MTVMPESLSTSCRNAHKYSVFCFFPSAFCGIIKASEKEWKTDGKVSEGCPAHGVQGHNQPTEYDGEEPE